MLVAPPKAAYTLATGLFIGFGGILGYIPLMAAVLPKSALIPILLFVGVDIVSQSFHAVPKRHAMAVAFAFFPNIANLVLIIIKQTNFMLLFGPTNHALAVEAAGKFIPESVIDMAGVFLMLGNGFILTGMLWGGALAFLADRKAPQAAITLLVAAGLTLFGVIHSCEPSGSIYLPWREPSTLPYEWALGYVVIAVMIMGLSMSKEFKEPIPDDAAHA